MEDGGRILQSAAGKHESCDRRSSRSKIGEEDVRIRQ